VSAPATNLLPPPPQPEKRRASAKKIAQATKAAPEQQQPTQQPSTAAAPVQQPSIAAAPVQQQPTQQTAQQQPTQPQQPTGGLFQRLFPGALGPAPAPAAAKGEAKTEAAPAPGERRWRWPAGGRLGTLRVRVRPEGDEAVTVGIAGLGLERAVLRRTGAGWRGSVPLRVPCTVSRRTGLIGRSEEKKVCPVESVLVIERMAGARIQGLLDPWGEGDLDCETCMLRRSTATPFEWVLDDDTR
jgi:hypothetical protein